jgi:virginiamycin B lyase
MRGPVVKCATLVVLLFSIAWMAHGSTISGTVKGPDGSPYKGAFVEAQDMDSRITTVVLSDKNGRYHIENLPEGQFRLMVRAVGYRFEPRADIQLVGGQNITSDIALEPGTVRWTDLSIYQGEQLLPQGRGREKLTTACFRCHGFQSRMAAQVRDESGWHDRVNYMRTSFGYLLRDVNEKDGEDVTAYLTKYFGPDSPLPHSPAELPAYQNAKLPAFSDDAMKIVYVTFDMPGTNRFPGSAKPERDGNVWIWEYRGHWLGKLDPKSGVISEYPVPNVDQASIHSVVVGADGTVWFSEQATDTIGKMDPSTHQITRYREPSRGTKHTLVVDAKGMVWGTGEPLTRFDPETNTFHDYPEVKNAYGLALDKDDNVWFSEFSKDGKIGKVDSKTGKLTKYQQPTPESWPRRLKIDAQGNVWFCEYEAGKIGRFDPKTETFKEYALPGGRPTPYALVIDKSTGHLWFSSMEMDTISELDPATGKVALYPFLFPENGMRDFFQDADGRIWWGSQANNRVGYFYLAGSAASQRAALQIEKGAK